MCDLFGLELEAPENWLQRKLGFTKGPESQIKELEFYSEDDGVPPKVPRQGTDPAGHFPETSLGCSVWGTK